MYDIKIDKKNDLVDIQLGGMLSIEEVSAYIAELKRLFVLNKLTRYVMIVDVSGCPIQSQDTIQAMGQHMASMPKAKAIAIVTGSSLARMQIRRLFTQSYARVTSSLEEARAWVLSGTEPKPA